LLKTFFLGVLLGLFATAGVLYAVPVVDQVRETSIVTVAPNGGNIETFRINMPMDRVLSGAPGQAESLPPGLNWPEHELLASSRTEMFKIRNARDTVVGVAVRNAAEGGEEIIVDWVLHLPARGSIFVNMDAVPSDSGYRLGTIRAGSREFAPMNGFMTERWVENESEDEDAPQGHIELITTYVGQLEREEILEVVE
jgi:hypothetical protein